MQEPGSVPGYFEQEAIKSASSALQLCSLPADQCQAYLALGKAQLALHRLKVGGWQAAMQLAWPEESQTNPGGDLLQGVDITKVIMASCMTRHAAGCNAGRGKVWCFLFFASTP